MASGSYRTIKIWNLENFDKIKELNGHNDVVSSIEYSPDGKKLVSGGFDHTIKIWNLENGAQIVEIKILNRFVRSVAISLDGKTLASASDDKIL